MHQRPGFRRRRWVRPAAAVLFAAALILLFNAPDDLVDRGDKLASIISAFLALAGLIVAVIGLRQQRDRSVQLQQARDDLARWIDLQWTEEAKVRLLDQPSPLRVRWAQTTRPVSPTMDEILGRQGVPRWQAKLRLSGDATTVVNRFLELPAQQLVILGRAGAGKSVLTILLTLGLLRDRTPDGRVPILLALATWDPLAEHLDAWIARQLAAEYPTLSNRQEYGRDPAVRLLQDSMLIPILDGLDEMPDHLRGPALAELNRVIGGGRPVVVACRAQEYEKAIGTLGSPLARAAVVELEAIDVDDAAALLAANQVNGQQRWSPVVNHLKRHPHGPLAHALSTPLMVFLARTVYAEPGRNPADLCDERRWSQVKLIEAHLLDGYLPAVYAHRRAPPVADGEVVPLSPEYSASEAIGWLRFLARYMTALETGELGWWQFIHLARPLRAPVGAGLALLTSLAIGVSLALAVPAVGVYLLSSGLIPALLVWESATKVFDTDPADAPLLARIRLDATKALRAATQSTVLGGFFGILAGWMVGYFTEPGRGFLIGAAVLLSFAAIVGLLALVVDAHVHDPGGPLSIWQRDRAASLVQALAIGVPLGAFAGLAVGLTRGSLAGVLSGLLAAVAAGLTAAWRRRSFQLSIAQSWLARQHHLPRQLIVFIDDAYQRGVLRQHGNVYQFRHALLQGRLAIPTSGAVTPIAEVRRAIGVLRNPPGPVDARLPGYLAAGLQVRQTSGEPGWVRLSGKVLPFGFEQNTTATSVIGVVLFAASAVSPLIIGAGLGVGLIMISAASLVVSGLPLRSAGLLVTPLDGSTAPRIDLLHNGKPRQSIPLDAVLSVVVEAHEHERSPGKARTKVVMTKRSGRRGRLHMNDDNPPSAVESCLRTHLEPYGVSVTRRNVYHMTAVGDA